MVEKYLLESFPRASRSHNEALLCKMIKLNGFKKLAMNNN